MYRHRQLGSHLQDRDSRDFRNVGHTPKRNNYPETGSTLTCPMSRLRLERITGCLSFASHICSALTDSA
jgi:hypothetical protein